MKKRKRVSKGLNEEIVGRVYNARLKQKSKKEKTLEEKLLIHIKEMGNLLNDPKIKKARLRMVVKGALDRTGITNKEQRKKIHQLFETRETRANVRADIGKPIRSDIMIRQLTEEIYHAAGGGFKALKFFEMIHRERKKLEKIENKLGFG